MFRMVDVPKHFQPVAVQLALCVLIACLGTHFLLEDTRLLAFSPSSDPAQVSNQSYDEVTHLDDVVILACLPVYLADRDAPVPAPWIVPLEKQASFPILIPPKIG